MKIDIDEIERTAQAMTRWRDEHLAHEQECVACRDTMHTPSDLEPTPLCNLCAQRLADDVPELLARIRRLEVELARAAGVARAHGEDDYADDFMRVAQDRDDFDAQVRNRRVTS